VAGLKFKVSAFEGMTV